MNCLMERSCAECKFLCFLDPCVISTVVTLKLFNAWIIYARNTITSSKTQTLSVFFFWREQLINGVWLIKVILEN